MSFLAYAVAAWLLLIGLYGVVSSRNLLHLILCLSVVQASTYVLLLAIGYRTGAERRCSPTSRSRRRSSTRWSSR